MACTIIIITPQMCNSTADICDMFWLNCAFHDRSVTFCTELVNVIAKIFGYHHICPVIFEKGRHYRL